ncbi:hypothetical protein DFJ74DRAFT_606005 [Hyaloraphidium curvatum]|nr:hypothetical protein DFJ74DRAFT_606005 [Hyaloraphidium curvatum]
MQRRDTREDAPRVSLRKAAAEGGIRIVGVTHIAYARDKNILVTAGEDKNSFPIVRVWNLDKMDRVTGRPQMLREIQASVDKKPIPITAIALLPALTHLAIGLENGVVVLVRGDLTRAERSTKTKTVYEGDSMVTGLLFAEGGQQGGAPRVDLVVVNRSRVVKFLLARPEALHVFSSDTGRSSAWFVSESSPPSELLGHGEKAALSWYRGYFALVTRWPVLASGRVEGVSGGDEADKQVSLLTLYDLRNRFVSFSAIFTRDGAGGEDEAAVGIWAVWSQWGYLWVITDDKRIYRLSEKDLNTRLELLFRRSMYSLALAVVQSEQQAALLGLPGADRSALDLDSSDPADRPSGPYDYNIVTEIHKRYGDWLYSKADHDAAMAQYILTIPHLESSYVIRRFLDVQRTDQLTRYLEALHAKGAATPDHTTLLLNCYAKAKDEAKLSAFLGKEDSDLAFDVETAVAVCRSAGYARQALALAARYGHHDSHVAIQVEDLREYAGAVDYISNLPFADAARAAARYGAVLVDQVPEGMTEVLTRLCTGWYPVRRAARGPKEEGGTPKSALAAGLGISAGKKSPAAGRPRDSAPGSTNSLPRANAAEFLQLFAGQSKVKTRFCIRFLEEVLERRGKGRVYSAADVERSLTGQGGVQMLGLDEAESGIVDEAAVSTPAREASAEAESQLLWNTLLELELSQSVASNVSTGSRARSPVVQDWKPRAMALLKDPNANYDPDHSLVLCQSRGFSEGVLYLTEKLQLFNDLMRLHMQARNYPAVVAICLGHGDEHVALWTESLAYFAAEADDPRAQTELHRLLAEIDRRKLMPLLQVLQILSGPGSTVTIGMVRDYILKHVRKQKEQIEEDRKLTKEYQEETARMRQEIEDLQTKPVLFENTICSSCNQTLDLPSVHYYCKHSYHERCLPITDTLAETGYPECPKCEPNNRMVLEMIRSQEARAADPEQFRRAMAKNPTGDRWDVVAEWYGRNVFWTPRQSGSSILPSSVRK